MCAWIVPPVAGLIELTIPPEINAKNIGAISISDGKIVIYLYDEQMPLDAKASEPMKVVTGKIIGQVADVPAVIGKLALCLVKGPAIVPDTPFKPHVVR